MKNSKGQLFLVPTYIGNRAFEQNFPAFNLDVLGTVTHWVVENVRDFRRFLRDSGIPSPYDHLNIVETHKRADPVRLDSMIKALSDGQDVAVVSDAGCPGIADPGSEMVRRAHQIGAKVRPLIGPSSIPMAIMASGLNGQNFRFHGYLPVKDKDRAKRLRELETESRAHGCTQIFIETPYRNNPMLKALLSVLSSDTALCVAYGIQTEKERIVTKSIKEWNRAEWVLEKEPCVFLFQS